MNLYQLSRLFWMRQKLRRRDRWTRAQLQRHQERALHLLRTHAYARSPFYQRFHKGLMDRPLHELPVLSKALLMEHFDALVTDRAVLRDDVEAHVRAGRASECFLGRYRVLSTSGSTGLRGLFLFNEREWLNILASYARATRDWTNQAQWWPMRRKAAGVSSATPWHISANVNAALRSRWSPALVMDATEPLASMVERLNAWRPELLMGYPSALYALAQMQLARSLEIAPTTIVTSSEVLTDEMRRRIQQAWGCAVFDEYGTTEGACLAAECDHHRGLHLFEDLVIVEVVDEQNQPVPVGMYGAKVLLTVLFSRTQPLIRYELSDRVRLAGAACSCGRPFALLDSIEGRLEQVLYFETAAGQPRAVHPNVFHRALEGVTCTGWQVVQEAEQLRVLLSGVGPDFQDADLITAIERELAAQTVIVPPITVQRLVAIPRGATGKRPLIVSNVYR